MRRQLKLKLSESEYPGVYTGAYIDKHLSGSGYENNPDISIKTCSEISI
jgi:hypothetical protein